MRADAVTVEADPIFQNRRHQIIASIARHAVPAIYFSREFATDGGLVSYGANILDDALHDRIDRLYKLAGMSSLRDNERSRDWRPRLALRASLLRSTGGLRFTARRLKHVLKFAKRSGSNGRLPWRTFRIARLHDGMGQELSVFEVAREISVDCAGRID